MAVGKLDAYISIIRSSILPSTFAPFLFLPNYLPQLFVMFPTDKTNCKLLSRVDNNLLLQLEMYIEQIFQKVYIFLLD